MIIQMSLFFLRPFGLPKPAGDLRWINPVGGKLINARNTRALGKAPILFRIR